MSTAEHKTYHYTIDHDVEIRIKNFRNSVIAALCNFINLIVLGGIIWIWIQSFLFAVFIPFPMRCVCTVVFCFKSIAESAWLFRILNAIAAIHILEFVDENRLRKQDLGARTTNFEDWILANCCVVAGLLTVGCAAWYWMEIIKLTVRSLFFWACMMAGLCFLFWLFKRAMLSYRKARGLEHGELWCALIGVNALRLYDRLEWPLGQFLTLVSHIAGIPNFLLYVVGFNIGRGPLFDRIPEEMKIALRYYEPLGNFPPFFAGTSNRNEDNKEDSQDRNDTGEAYFHPSDFEWQPNPVIFFHLRAEQAPSSDSEPSLGENILDCHSENITGVSERLISDTVVNLDDKCIPSNIQRSFRASRNTGPMTMSPNLSSFACPQCTYVAGKKYKLNKHITQTHDRRFLCVHPGCLKTFGLRTNLERHEATHIEGKKLRCSNPWCKLPRNAFTREDNLKRHMKQCIPSE